MIVKNSKNSRVARLIESLKSKMEFNEMSPIYIPQPLRVKDGVASISKETLQSRWEYLGSLLNLSFYWNHSTDTIVGGKFLDDGSRLVGAICIEISDEEYDFLPFKENYIQIGLVNVSKKFSDRGLARETYIWLTEKVTIVSDTEQYFGGRKIWESIAKDKRINVYVWNGNTMDWFRDDTGKAIRFNGKNIEPNEIWGTEYEEKILLVATREEIK